MTEPLRAATIRSDRISDLDLWLAHRRAEDIRKSIAQRPVQTSRGLVHVTMSVGLLLSKEWGFRPVEELLQEVDAALYAAKGAGRNCVKVATPKIQPDPVDTLVPELARRRR